MPYNPCQPATATAAYFSDPYPSSPVVATPVATATLAPAAPHVPAVQSVAVFAPPSCPLPANNPLHSSPGSSFRNGIDLSPPLSPSPMRVLRVTVPDGMAPGQQIRVKSPDGAEVVKAIPPRSEWHRDGTRAFFWLKFGSGGSRVTPLLIVAPPSYQQQYTPAAAYNPYENPANGPPTSAIPAAAATYNPYNNQTNAVHAAAAAAAASSYNPYENPANGPPSSSAASCGVGGGPEAAGCGFGAPTTAPPPHSVEWRHFRIGAPPRYDPPRGGVRSVPSVPRGLGPGLPPNGRHKALIVGINYKKSHSPLRGCVNDARKMMSLLNRNGYPDDGSHMLLLTDEKGRGPEYQPTAENIMKALRWLMRDVRRGDVLFFHFSGHGRQKPDMSGHETDGYNETILPVDFERWGQITDDVLWGSLVYELPEGARLTALMDMCHSGTGLDLPYDYDVNARRWREDTNPAHSSGDVVLFSGCEDSQTSADVLGGFGRKAGGAMTMAFTKAYEKTAAMPTYHAFLEAVKRQLKSGGLKQRPQLTSSQMFEAESRIFSLGCWMPSLSGLGGGTTNYIEPNHNSAIGRHKLRHVRPAR